MNLKTRFLKPVAAALVLGLSLSASNDDTTKISPDYGAEAGESQKDTFADMAFSEAQAFADEAAATGNVNVRLSGTERLLPNCATVTHDTVGTPNLITIDFGATNCLGNDGRTRRGKILISYTGPYRQDGTVITIGFDDYFLNDNQILGTKTVTNLGRDLISGFVEYSIQVNGQVLFATGDTATWQASRLREWTAGDSTVMLADDVYQITGNGTGTRANGRTYSTLILTPLVRKLAPGCRRHFVSGQLRISPQNLPERVLDYGSGTCYNLATVTKNGNTYPIQLP